MEVEKDGVQIEKLPAVIGIARAAEIAGVSRRTVRRWISGGRLPASRVLAGGSSRVFISTRALLRVLGVPVEPENG